MIGATGALWQDPTPQQAGSDFGNVERVHPVMLAVLGLLVVLLVSLPRRHATWPLVLLLCFVPAGQRFVLATLDFPFVRVLILAAWARLVARDELRPLLWNRLDRLLLGWAFVSVMTGTLEAGTLTVFVNRSGAALDALCTYFFFRQVIRTPADVAATARQFLWCSFAVLAVMLYEHRTMHNMFGIFGGVPEITDMRDGRLRCQGAFAHPILAGCFYATLLPFYAVLGFRERRWKLPVFGAVTAIAITFLTASSTPIVAVLMCGVAAAVFPFRSALRYGRWLGFAVLVMLHFSMKQPIWHLLARIDVAGGSTGWHRFHLVDKFFLNWHEWWLLGVPRTGHWGPGLQDVTNQYVAEGVGGGVMRLLLFVLVIVVAFQGVSRSLRVPGIAPAERLTYWALGTALFLHCMNFIGVTYFEQIMSLWFFTLAAIGSTTLVRGAAPSRQLAAQNAVPAGA